MRHRGYPRKNVHAPDISFLIKKEMFVQWTPSCIIEGCESEIDTTKVVGIGIRAADSNSY